MSTIAARYGVAKWQTLFDHPDNAELKDKRKNPNVLLPGDRVTVPDREQKEVDCPTGKNHRFRVKLGRALVRVVLQKHDGTPHAGARWVVAFNGEEVKGETGDDGLIEASVPLHVDRCLVSAWYKPGDEETTDEDLGLPPDEEEAAAASAGDEEGKGEDEPPPDVHYVLRLGHLDPHDTITGVQARLRNLGFGGKVTGTLDEATLSILRRFREAEEMSLEGEMLDDAVMDRLRSLHDGEA